jgi:pimeloyl-ACP methyl ester carboxylesterase
MAVVGSLLVAGVQQKRVRGISYREARPEEDSELATVLCVHGFPETSYMWRHLLQALAESGRRAIARDLPGFGDSPPDPPGTWERHVEALERFRRELGLQQVGLIVHDWGGLIGLRWACEHPDPVAALVVSNTGFFRDGKWHGMARALRTPGEGERLVAAMTEEGLEQMLGTVSRGVDRGVASEYWKTFETEEGKGGILELYRSGDFETLAAYDGRLSQLGVPTLILWGEDDLFAPVAGAHRFKREIPDAKLVVLEGAGHFVYADEPSRCASEVVGFLDASDV